MSNQSRGKPRVYRAAVLEILQHNVTVLKRGATERSFWKTDCATKTIQLRGKREGYKLMKQRVKNYEVQIILAACTQELSTLYC